MVGRSCAVSPMFGAPWLPPAGRWPAGATTIIMLLLVQSAAVVLLLSLLRTVSAGAGAAVAGAGKAGGPAALLRCPGPLPLAGALGAAVAAAGAASAAAAAPPAALQLLARRHRRVTDGQPVCLQLCRRDVTGRAALLAVLGGAALHAVVHEHATGLRAVPSSKLVADVAG